MAITSLINGKPADHISIRDRGLQYGDGLFETIAVDQNKALCLDEHLVRLDHGCHRLAIESPDVKILQNEINQLSQAIDKGIIKVMLTRGEGSRGYAPPRHAVPNRIMALYDWPELAADNYTNGVKTRLCQTRYSQNSVLAGIKHMNRLEQVLARSEWSDTAYAEGLVRDQADNLIEGTMSNLFLVKDNIVFTPDIGECGVNGVIREKIMQLSATLGFGIKVKKINYEFLLQADEAFVCNSIIGLWPLNCIDDNHIPLGETAQQLRHALKQNQHIAASC